MKRLITDKQLKEKLGGCSDMTIWRLQRDGKLPARQPKRDARGRGGRGDCQTDRVVDVDSPSALVQDNRWIFDGWTSRFARFSFNIRSTPVESLSQHSAKPSTAAPTSQGRIGFPLTRANGPSDSVSTRACGIRLAKSLPRLLANIADPTLNQHPSAIARSSSRGVPENQ